MNHATLFSGIGAPELAASRLGWNNVFHCEIEAFPRKVLQYHFPNSISYEDIRTTDFTIHRGNIDVLTGGFPCQPFSLAGKRKGTEDPRNLWPEYFRAIREIAPRWVVGENVYGIINWSKGMVFEQVQADLESEGYEVAPIILPACSVGAPHRRERIFFVAYRNECTEGSPRKSSETKSNRSKDDDEPQSRGEQTKQHYRCSDVSGDVADTCLHGHKLRKSGKNRQEARKSQGIKNKRERLWNDNRRNGQPRNATNTQRQRLQKSETKGQQQPFFNVERDNTQDVADTISKRQRGESNGIGETGFINETSTGNDWQNFPTQSPVCSGNDGLSSRLDGITFPKWRQESIKAYGNAIVPQVIFQIYKVIDKYIDNAKPSKIH